MTEIRKLYAAVITSSLLLVSSSFAHHSFGAFDLSVEAEILVTGVVKEWRLVNPHSSLTITVTNEAGEPIDWALESAQVPQLIVRGITRDTYRPGDAVSAMVGPLRDGRPGGLVKWVKHADGNFTFPNQTGTNSGQPALDRWLSENPSAPSLAVQAQDSNEVQTARNNLVEFHTSCSEAVTSEFNSAVEQLHSYEYPESERIFRSVLESEPDCAMARWGVAMSLWHSTWVPPSLADLDTGAAMLASIDRATVTTREAAYIEALSLFYTNYETSPHQARAEAYRDRMQQVYADNLDDPEAAIFYALSLLATADPQDKSYATQFKSAGILNWVRNTKPRHPGVLHYIIHNYDYPGMAHLALDAATIYAEVATNSTHAQHMPSHIFTRLGLWDRSISSNHDSHASAVEYTQRASLVGHYDEGIHSIDYLMYAYLQMAQDEAAGQLLTELRTMGKAHLENFKVAFTYASSPARYALERRQWLEASEITLMAADFPWQDFGWARSIHHFARGIGAARSDQLGLAREELELIREIAGVLPDETPPYLREEVFVHADAVSSWVLLGEGDTAEALRLAEAAAIREDAVDKHPVTPGETLPARELFADMLLSLDRPDDALEQYRIVLAGSPNRTNALLGAARAATGSGETDIAAEYYQTLLDQTASGNPNRDGLQEARELIANLD